MREWRKIAGGPDRSTTRHDREHARCEAGEEQLDGLHAGSRVALGERVRAQEHRRADYLVGIGLADPARMRAEQPELELGGLLGGNCNRHEAAETGVDAVRVLAAAVSGVLHEIARGVHLVSRL